MTGDHLKAVETGFHDRGTFSVMAAENVPRS
jgi:hypothetical protein